MTIFKSRSKLMFSSVLFLSAFVVFAGWAHADYLGQTVTFSVNSKYDDLGRSQVAATLQVESLHGYFYIDQELWNKLTSQGKTRFLQNTRLLADEFDNRIYPQMTAFWGSEANPGIDHDPRVTIFIEKLKQGYGGYFDTKNGYSRQDIGDSNEREMIFIADYAVGSEYAKVFLSHEFQHLISQNQKDIPQNVPEQIWLNELRSEYTSTFMGYNQPYQDSNLFQRVSFFNQNSYDSLTQWPNLPADYGIAAVFGEYLAQRFSPVILSDSLHSSQTGMQSLNDYLSRTQASQDMGLVFGDWMLAISVNDQSLGSSYGYQNSDLQSIRIAPEHVEYLGNVAIGNFSASVRPWQPLLEEIRFSSSVVRDTKMPIKLAIINSTVDPVVVSAVVFYADGSREVVPSQIFKGQQTFYLTNGDKTTPVADRKIIDHALVALAVPASNERSDDDRLFSISINTSLATEEEYQQSQPTTGPLADGMLIKRQGNESEVYVVEGHYKRYLSSKIISLYGHLQGVMPVAVSDEVFDSYRSTNYVRSVNDKRVFAVWPDGTKHWLNISAQQFSDSGRDWNAIFIVNDAEIGAYGQGADIRQ